MKFKKIFILTSIIALTLGSGIIVYYSIEDNLILKECQKSNNNFLSKQTKIDKKFGIYNGATSFYFVFDSSELHFSYNNYYSIGEFNFNFRCDQDIFFYRFGKIYSLKEAYDNKVIFIWDVEKIYKQYNKYLDGLEENTLIY